MDTLKGTVTFKDKNTIEIEGKIMRIKDLKGVIFLSKKIPFNILVKEKRDLINKYPDLFS